MTAGRLSWRARWWALRCGVLTAVSGRHVYVSTGCLHGRGDYCAAPAGRLRVKVPQSCKFCGERCVAHGTGGGGDA